MIAITTNNSMSVKPRRGRYEEWHSAPGAGVNVEGKGRYLDDVHFQQITGETSATSAFREKSATGSRAERYGRNP